MQIVSSQVQASSQHALRHNEQQVSVRRPLPPTNTPAPVPAQPAPIPSAPATASTAAEGGLEGGDEQLSLLKSLVEALTGQTIATLRINTTPPPAAELPSNISAPAGADRALRVDMVQISETEITEVSFAGQFSTADGQQLSMSLQFSLQRSYSAMRVSATVGNPNAKDPLILNFNGLGAALSPTLTQFDLNGDGSSEALPTLAPGSAYLALDRNGDGKIANGSELFGPTSGDGFVELSQLDDDGNGFIDSGDKAFSQLFLFRPGDPLTALASKDIGAIFLGNIASPARLTDSNNQSLGQLRASSFYLTNQGGSGLVQQLDLVV